jgi:large subunit ribosomal protein L22
VGEALGILRYSRKRVARDLSGLMNSVVANAQQKQPGVDVDELVVARAVVDEAPPMKRSRHASLGRVFPVLKRACHVTIDVDVPKKARVG